MLKSIFIFFLLITTTVSILGQKTGTDSTSKIESNSIPTITDNDTLKILNIESAEPKKVWYKDNNMPWVIALVISIVGFFLNLLIANKQISGNIKQSNKNNRQTWVSETRNVISELLTQANLLNIEFQEQTINPERRKILHEKFSYNKNKLNLLLNPAKEKHKLLLESLDQLLTTLDTHMFNSHANNNPNLGIGLIPYDNGKFMQEVNKVIENGRILLYDEWGKIQK